MKAGNPSGLAGLEQHWLARIDSALQISGLGPAARLAIDALSAGVDHPSILNLAAQAHYADGRTEEAVDLLRRAHDAAPDDANILNSLAICLQQLGEVDQALAAFDDALRLDPSLPAAQCNRAALLKELGEISAARAGYRSAIALDPTYLDALAGLAWLEAEAGNADAAEPLARQALDLSPSHALARLALAAAALHRRDLDGAEAIVLPLVQDPALTPVNRAIALGFAGDVLDARGQAPQAFLAYQASNQALKALNAPRFEGTESALDQVRRISAWVETADLDSLPAAPRGSPAARKHVFLVGFPRSGTTLLENVLAAHPEVVTLEERDCLERIAAPFIASNDGLDRLANLSAAEKGALADDYWALVRRHGVNPDGAVFIDKFPLSSVLLVVVATIFPEARILFAIRDPRDVVLSCFRRRFGINPAMYELLTLEGAATFYDAVMRLSDLYRERLSLPWHDVRHESLIDDFEGTSRRVCAFLGLDWTPEMLDFAAKAQARGISTPSAAQVARGLNRDGQDAWRRYADQMAPVLPILDPWVDAFGYTRRPSNPPSPGSSKPSA